MAPSGIYWWHRMAKKKQVSKPPAQEPARGQVSIINLKGTDEYRSWLAAESKRTHIPAASIVRIGLSLWARENGAAAPPEK